MKKAILATKIGMTQIFNADGVLVPVTVLEAGPCVVTQIKTVENDGYSAVQVGFGDKKEKVVEKDANGKKSVAHRHGVNKAQMGHLACCSARSMASCSCLSTAIRISTATTIVCPTSSKWTIPATRLS